MKFLFLICASPKSGSTFISQILNNHSRLKGSIFKENYILSRMLDTLDWLPDEKPMWDWVLREDPNFRDKIQNFIIDMTNTNEEYCAIKFTNFNNFKWLRTVIPDSKIIFLTRNLKDTYCSCKIQLENLGHINVTPEFWFNKYIWRSSKNICGIDNVHFITYEDFIKNTQDELHKIYSYLEWNFEFSLEGTKEIFENRSLQTNSNRYEMVTNEITDKRIGRYKHELSDIDMFRLNELEQKYLTLDLPYTVLKTK